MKTTRLLLAAALAATAAACSTDVTAPELRAPDAVSTSTAPAPEPTPTPTPPTGGEDPSGEGTIGSGVGK